MQTRLSRYCEGIMEAGWLAAAILIPLFFNIYSSRIFEPDKISLMRTLALVTLAAWLVKLVSEGGWRWERLQPEEPTLKYILRMPMIAPVVGLAAVYLVATIFSVTPSASLWGSYQRLQGTYTTFSYLVIFAALVGNLQKRTQVERLVTSIILTSLPIALYGILQRFKLDPIPWGGDVSVRIAANMGNSIFVAAYLIMVFPLTVGRIVESFDAILREDQHLAGHVARSTLYVFTGAVQLVALYMSGSRGPTLGWMAGSFFLFLLLALYWRKRRLVFGIVGVALGAGAFLFVFNLPHGPLESLRNLPQIGRFSQLLDPGANSALVRKYIWEGAAELVSPHAPLEYPDGSVDHFNFLRPLIGYGPESMYVAYNPFYRPELAYVERRNASPDRSHNETWDSLVITGLAGLIAYLAVFTSVFYYGLKWLGLIPNTGRRKLFFALYFGGGFSGAVGLAVWRGVEYMGVGLPFGIAIGLIIYLAMAAIFGEQQPAKIGSQSARSLIMIVLMAAIMAHFVEINFGIAIAVTRTYFWTYAGLLLLVGYILPKHGEYMILSPEPGEVGPEITRERRVDSPRKSKGRRRRNEKHQARWEQGLPGWLIQALMGGVLVGLIIATLGYEYLTLSPEVNSTIGILGSSLTRLKTANNAVSYAIPGLILLTWLAAGVVWASETEKYLPESNWVLAFLNVLGVSAAIGGVFWVWQAHSLASIAQDTTADLAGVLAHVRGFENLLTKYTIFIAILIAGLAALVPEEWPQRASNPRRLGVMLAPIALVITAYLGFSTNLRVVQADIAFKIADPYVKQGAWPVAIEIYDHAIELAPTEDFYYLFLGRAYLEYGRSLDDANEREKLIQQAKDDLKKAQALNPLNTDHTANLARLYSLWASFAEDQQTRQERGQTAAEYFSKAVTLSPKNARIWDEWGLLYMNILGAPEEAYERFSRALEIDPEYDWTHGLLGDYYLILANSTDGQADKNRALEKSAVEYHKAMDAADPADVQSKYNYAIGYSEVYVRLNQPNQAISGYITALQLVPNTAERWQIEETIGQLYVKIGDATKALNHLGNALALAPSDQREHLQTLIGQLQAQK